MLVSFYHITPSTSDSVYIPSFATLDMFIIASVSNDMAHERCDLDM